MLNRAWIDRLFEKLQGIYGQQFTGKFSKVINGVDVGVENAKQAWAEELSGFNDQPEAIAYALKHMPTTHCPNAKEFLETCRKAPKKEVLALPHKLTDEEKQHQAEQAAKFADQVKHQTAKDHHLWAKRPRSQLAYNDVLKLAETDLLFRNYVLELDAKGYAKGKKLIKCWNGNAWVQT